MSVFSFFDIKILLSLIVCVFYAFIIYVIAFWVGL